MIREILIVGEQPYVQFRYDMVSLILEAPGECFVAGWVPFEDHVPFQGLEISSMEFFAGLVASLEDLQKEISGDSHTTWFILGMPIREIQGVPNAQGAIPVHSREWITCVILKGLWRIAGDKVVKEE